MTATNGRGDAATILSASDALVGAAECARLALLKKAAAEEWPDLPGIAQAQLLDEAAKLAQVAQGLATYAAMAGKWAAR